MSSMLPIRKLKRPFILAETIECDCPVWMILVHRSSQTAVVQKLYSQFKALMFKATYRHLTFRL
jgi:hypothetical protein